MVPKLFHGFFYFFRIADLIKLPVLIITVDTSAPIPITTDTTSVLKNMLAVLVSVKD
jgi:hypothetical protein